jgi:serine/threonine protein kinase
MDYNLTKFYGITRNPETEEFMIISRFAEQGNLRNILSNNFNNIFWKEKINMLWNLSTNLKNSHEMGYFHKNFHSGNIFYNSSCKRYYISDYGIYGLANSNNKIYGVLPYIAPEVLNGKSHTLSSDVYSFGIIMTELSSGKPPFYNKKHDSDLALEICEGLRPEFGERTPEIYKKLANKCMNANSNQRPTSTQLSKILEFWYNSIIGEIYGYKEEKIKTAFENSDKEIRNISILYERNHDAIYTSRDSTFSNLLEPINSDNFENDHKSCSYCGKSFIEEFWCEECDPYNIMEGWNSGDSNIDKFIKDTIYDASQKSHNKFLEWAPFDRFIDKELIGKGRFSEVYSATWIDGPYYYKSGGNWKRLDSGHEKVVLKKLKRLNSSQNISVKYLNEVLLNILFICYNIYIFSIIANVYYIYNSLKNITS